MFRIAIFCVCAVFLIQPLAFAADSATQLFPILRLVDEKKYAEAIAGYEQYMQAAPPWFQGPIQFEIATLQAAQGNNHEALETLETAIQSGFDDCFAVKQSPEWNSFRENSQFATLHARMRISEADYRELAWLKAEIDGLNQAPEMMNTQDTNPGDTGAFEIMRAEIPTRQTTSTAVLFNRELLKVMQERSIPAQKSVIQQRKFILPTTAGSEPRACIELE